MREIKFRGWNKELNNFIYGETILLQEYNNRWVMLVDNELGEEWVYIEEPQQYTGLKDYNDYEIYEGDIFNIYENGNEYNYKIVYDGDCFMLAFIDSSQGSYPLSAKYRFSKVIGNIYENPELVS